MQARSKRVFEKHALASIPFPLFVCALIPRGLISMLQLVISGISKAFITFKSLIEHFSAFSNTEYLD
jgi:hypothetical protein